MSGRSRKRGRGFSVKPSGRARARPRFSRAGGRGPVGPRNLGFNATGAVGGRRRQNVRTAGFLGIEHKFYNTALINQAIATSTTAQNGVVNPTATSLISTVPQGDSSSERDGKKMMIESVQLNGAIHIPHRNGLSIGDDLPSYYIAIIQDTQTNAAAMVSEAAFQNPGASEILCTSPLKNLLSGNRFITHKVWNFVPPMPSMASEAVDDNLIMGQIIPFDFFKKVSIIVNFNGGTTASVANVVDNSLHVIAWTSDNSWATTISYNARIRFVG